MEDSLKKPIIVIGTLFLLLAVWLLFFKKNSVSPFQTKRTKSRGVVAPKMEISPVNFKTMSDFAPKEGFIVPPPALSQTNSFMLSTTGGTSKTTSNPFIGGLPGESIYGTSVPGFPSPTLMTNANDPGAKSVYATVI